MKPTASHPSATPDDAVVWLDGGLLLLDQRLLPEVERFVPCPDADAVARSIREMVVRGAPAIGVAAAYGVALAARDLDPHRPESWVPGIREAMEKLAASRPTAVNLFWALERMEGELAGLAALAGAAGGEGGPAGTGAVPHPADFLLTQAQALHAEDRANNRHMGELGAALLDGEPAAVLTHCNAGGLATGGYGTALGVIRKAWDEGRLTRVYADETRPWLQGARLTAWELERSGIPVTLLADGAAAARMAAGGISWVITGADRVAANGDVANKIGTYGLAVAARHHGVRFMVVAPTSTVDLSIPTGAEIPIEERDPDELLYCGGARIAPRGVDAWNPVFDVTPAELVDALVTEQGVILHPDANALASLRPGGAAGPPHP